MSRLLMGPDGSIVRVEHGRARMVTRIDTQGRMADPAEVDQVNAEISDDGGSLLGTVLLYLGCWVGLVGFALLLLWIRWSA